MKRKKKKVLSSFCNFLCIRQVSSRNFPVRSLGGTLPAPRLLQHCCGYMMKLDKKKIAKNRLIRLFLSKTHTMRVRPLHYPHRPPPASRPGYTGENIWNMLFLYPGLTKIEDALIQVPVQEKRATSFYFGISSISLVSCCPGRNQGHSHPGGGGHSTFLR